MPGFLSHLSTKKSLHFSFLQPRSLLHFSSLRRASCMLCPQHTTFPSTRTALQEKAINVLYKSFTDSLNTMHSHSSSVLEGRRGRQDKLVTPVCSFPDGRRRKGYELVSLPNTQKPLPPSITTTTTTTTTTFSSHIYQRRNSLSGLIKVLQVNCIVSVLLCQAKSMYKNMHLYKIKLDIIVHFIQGTLHISFKQVAFWYNYNVIPEAE